MTTSTKARKLTITVSEDFYLGLKRSAGLRQMGRFIEKHLSSIVATTSNLEAGYKAMAQDKEREAQAKEWCENLNGGTLANDAW